eukprot:795663_1
MSDLLICTSGQENYNHGIVLYNYVLPITYIFSAITMIPPVYRFVRVYYTNRLLSKLLFWSGLVAFTSIFLFLISAAIFSVFYCDGNEKLIWIRLLSVISMSLYWVQSSMLLQILFYRLYFIYRDTVLCLSKCTITVWIVYFTFASLLWTAGLIVYYTSESHSEYGLVMAAMGAMLCALSNVWLVGAFIYKLVKIHNYNIHNDDNTKYLNLVTKISLLCFISAVIYLANSIASPLLVFQTVYLDFVWRMIILADVYSSFLCVLLSYGKFDHWYQKICHFGHINCRLLCTQIHKHVQSNDSIVRTTIVIRMSSDVNVDVI